MGPAGQTFKFPAYQLFEGSALIVFSRAGDNTPRAVYWGASEALWSPGSIITLQDAAGQPQALTVAGE